MADDGLALSPVYSLAVHHKGLWLLSGLESGGINLQSVRHDEGKQIACLRQHSSAVSVLDLSRDESSVLSGSWDKTVIDWDLNTGQARRKFQDSGGQISALEVRPLSTLPVPEASRETVQNTSTFTSNGTDDPQTNGLSSSGFGHNSKDQRDEDDNMVDAPGSPTGSLFVDNDMESLFNDNGDGEVAAPSAGNFEDEDDDEFSRAIANGVKQEQDEDAEGGANLTDGAASAADPLVGSNSAVIDPLDGSDTKAASVGSQLKQSPVVNGIPHAEDLPLNDSAVSDLPAALDTEPASDTVFLAAEFDGSLRVWDKRRPTPIARIPPRNVPPWCMNACWSPDGNFIYAGRRNGTVEEFSLHKGLREVERSFKLPNGSGPVSAVRAMPNGRHLIWQVL
ncbi:MAG: hypothetical protein Q9190_007073 [Brigantiaea leucoxantha]